MSNTDTQMDADMDTEMRVMKRDGTLETVAFDKILNRIKTLGTVGYLSNVSKHDHSNEAQSELKINYTVLVMKVIDQLYDKISTTKIDELSAQQCASMGSVHPDYNTLAGRIIISNHQKNTSDSFVVVMTQLYDYMDKHGKHSPLISEELFQIASAHGEELEQMCDYSRDFLIDYFGFKTLERAYLMKINGKSVERIQHMMLRVAVGIHGANMEKVRETYNYMSCKYFTHATPTLFNAGTPHPQLSSCYLIAMEGDSVDGIYNTLKDCALISKWAGGIGLHIHNVRAAGSHIRGTNGTSNGIVPMLKVFNNTAKYIDQCVHPETIIYTTQGPKQIQHCIVGETEIYNLNGEVETIENVLEHCYEGEILEICSMHSLHPLCITPEHPVFALCGQQKGLNYKVIKNRLDKKICEIEWVDAKDLTQDDMLVYRIPTYQKDISSITSEDCYMYGIILGDGSMCNKTDSAGYVSMHTVNKKHIADFMEEYFMKNCVEFKKTVDNNTTRIRWNRNIHLPFRYNDFYDETKDKRVQARWLNLPIEKSKNILKGLIDTDGCISTNKSTEIVFDSTSINLIESVRFLCMRMGVLTSGYIRDRVGESHETKRGIIENKRISYCLRIPKTKEICDLLNIEYNDKNFFKFMRYNDYLLSRIQDIRTEQYKGVLYDLQMKDEHNYLLHNGVVHNGGGRRNGSFAIYLEPWHADIEIFLQMRKNHGDEELKARDLFYALWIPDLFMERVKSNGKWTLMCPDECPGLSDVYGEEFNALYTKYEAENRGRISINARDLWFQILDAQMETGTPYLLYKDAVNKKSNQKNIGIIKSSNLCCEIVQYSDDKETAVCNLASIALPMFVDANGEMDYNKLHEVAKVVAGNLNRIIDVNYYPTPKTRLSNMRHRPVGIGVQGLADVFMLMNIPFHSEEAKKINRDIFETIYHAALERSCELAVEEGPYETFAGSPASQGLLQFDMWNVEPGNGRYNWNELKEYIKTYGLRNSLLLAPMPTASTSQILGFNECIEPITSNIYSRRTLAGEFILTNKYLMNDLLKLDLWNEKIKNNIISNNGSVQHIDVIPQEIRDKYKTIWEIPMRHLIDMSADRGAFICQSQSLNLWLEDPNYNTLTSMHFYSWSKGLKTGIYYLRRRARFQAQQFTIEPEKNNNAHNEQDEICEMCSA
jgi:ribonucleoside-diphosphate reductase alpha subunit